MSDGIDHQRPFVAEPAGDRSLTDRLAERAAARWGLAAPVFVRRGMNALYTAGDEVMIRVGRTTAPVHAAADLARLLTTEGVRVPRVLEFEPVVDADHTAYAVERLHPRRAADGSPTRSDEHLDAWVEVGAMIACLHRIEPERIAAIHPLPRAASFAWWRFDALLASVRDLLDEPTAARLAEVAATGRDWAGDGSDEVVCHGDLQPHNVVVTDDGPVIFDWDLLCRAPSAFDVAPLLSWAERWGGHAGLPAAFARGYGHDLSDDPLARHLGRLRLLAATLMRVAAGRNDAAARADAEQRLRWWRGDPDAPAWVPR